MALLFCVGSDMIGIIYLLAHLFICVFIYLSTEGHAGSRAGSPPGDT